MKNLKILIIIGLVFLTINQLLILNGDEFIQKQQPIDFVHWLLLIGAVLSLSVNNVFSNSGIGKIASFLTFAGVVALIGQATIDLVWWSFGTDYEGLIKLINQLESKPSIWITFMAVGPSFFYIGLAIHAVKFLKTNTFASIVVILSTIIIGLASLVWTERLVIVFGHIFLTIGIILLLYRKENVTQQRV